MSFDTRQLGSAQPQGSGDDGLDENILPKGAILQNRYEIIKVLGMGGMGAVYLSQDLHFTGIKRLCAVKEMTSTTPDPQVRRLAVESFTREANLLAELNHPGIPKIIDFFTESIRSYLVMEYIEGEDLEENLDNTEGMLKEDTVLNWGIQVCEVLTYLHSREIVFRDMKPANIMLRKGKDNRICLIDFGIAKSFEVGQKGTMIGTEGYSPPEQYRGVAEPRGDIYALGATLHHLLTKRDPRLEPPFTFHEEPVRLLNPTVSELANAAIMHALEYDPDKRFPNAEAFKEALDIARRKDTSLLDKARGASKPPSSAASKSTQMLTTPPPAQQPPQGYPQQPPQGYPPQGYPQQPPQGYPPQGYPQQPPPGYQPNATSMLTGMPGFEAAGDDDSILPVWKFKCEDELRGKAPSADDTTLFIGAYDNNIYALDLKDGKFKWKFATEGGIAGKPALYKDRLVFGSEDRLAYAITTSGRMIWTCPTEGRVRSSPIVAYDHAFFGSDDHRLYAVNSQTGRVIWRFEESVAPIRSSPTLGDELVYVGSEDGHLYAVDLSSGKAKWKFRANRPITSSPALYEDQIVVGSSDWNVYSIDAKSGYVNWRCRTSSSVISSPTIVDGTVYIGSNDKNLYAIDIKTGRVHWKHGVDAPIVSTPAVTDEAIYFGTTAGEVISVNRKDRKMRWKFKTGGAITSSPLVHDGIVYIGSTDHHVYALPA